MHVSKMRVFSYTCALFYCMCACVAQETLKTKTSALKPDEMFQDIFPLTADNFTSSVFRMKDPWIVIFHDGNMDKPWKTMATHLRGLCWVGMIDIRTEAELLKEMKFDSSLDAARVYKYGGRLTKERDWKRVRTQNEARALAVSSIPDKMKTVDPSRMTDFLLESFSSKPSRFPVYVIAEDNEASATFKALAVRFEKYFLFGHVTRPSQDDLKRLGLGDTYISPPAIFTIVTDDGQPDKISAIKYDVDSYGGMTYTKIMMYLFAVNGQFRHALPGENMSNYKKVAEMTDILKIEGERFEVFKNTTNPVRVKSSKGVKPSKEPAENVAFKMTAHTTKDEL